MPGGPLTLEHAAPGAGAPSSVPAARAVAFVPPPLPRRGNGGGRNADLAGAAPEGEPAACGA